MLVLNQSSNGKRAFKLDFLTGKAELLDMPDILAQLDTVLSKNISDSRFRYAPSLPAMRPPSVGVDDFSHQSPMLHQ